MERFLVTTADERSWKFDRPVLYLGEWCRRYSRKDAWEGMDAEVAESYGFPFNEKTRDLAYVQELTDRLLDEISDGLNAAHAINRGTRYWNIVLGHWLERYVCIMFNRYFTVDKAVSAHEISGTLILSTPDYSLATADSESAVRAANDDLWNHVLYGRVLRHRGDVEIFSDSQPLSGVRGYARRFRPGGPTPLTRKQAARRLASRILSRFARKADAFIINSYLPLRTEIELQVRMGQVPQLWRSPRLYVADVDPRKREAFRIDHEAHSGFERFIREELSGIIPTCYLEGYQTVGEQVEALAWPLAPKLIFTSNNYNTDEVFKRWLADKVDEGSLYFAGQHGANYGTHFFNGNPHRPEQTTCDRFFSWGWESERSWVVPAFNFKIDAKKVQQFSPGGGLLLIESVVPFRVTPWDNYFEFGMRQEDQFRFAEALPVALQHQLTVRLHGGFRSQEWSDVERWQDRMPDVQVEQGVASIADLIGGSRLVAHGYDSTGLLETLAANVPTVAFWYYGLEQLLPSAHPYFQLLVDAGILFVDPQKAAGQIASHWDEVDKWWSSRLVQDARVAFCAQFSRTERHPAKVLKALLIANRNEWLREKQDAERVGITPEPS